MLVTQCAQWAQLPGTERLNDKKKGRGRHLTSFSGARQSLFCWGSPPDFYPGGTSLNQYIINLKRTCRHATGPLQRRLHNPTGAFAKRCETDHSAVAAIRTTTPQLTKLPGLPIPTSSTGPDILLHLSQSAARSSPLASAPMDGDIHRQSSVCQSLLESRRFGEHIGNLLWDYGAH